MSKQIEALKIAIELCEKSIKGLEGDENSGLCSVNDEDIFGDALREYYELLQACKEALAEAEKQEPVAEVIEDKLADWSKPHVAVKWNKVDFKIGTKFYTHPAPSWQSLSDDEIQKELKNMWDKGLIPSYSIVEFARAIEQALKELNAKK